MEVKRVNGVFEAWRQVIVLARVGGLAFWVVNFVVSLTPVAAEYRAALSISYYPMLAECLVGGLAMAALIGFLLLRFYDRIPASGPVLKAILLSTAALVIVTVVIGSPSSYSATGNIWRYFLIGTGFNGLRFLALGIAIGYYYKKHYGGELQ